MKTLGKFKLILGLFLVTIIGLISLNSFAKDKESKTVFFQSENVSITIDSDTSAEQLNDIKDMLKEHGITVKFTNIKRNADGEIIGIKIELKDENGNTAVSETSSNMREN